MGSTPQNNFGTYFPPRVVDADGRRVRPGSIVATLDDDPPHLCQVQGWSREGLVLLTVNDDEQGNPHLLVRHPSRVRKHDAELIDVVLQDELYIEADGPSSVLVECIGTRDVVVRDIAADDGYVSQLPELSDFEMSDESETFTRVAVRDWSKAVLDTLLSLAPDKRFEVVRRELDAPIFKRVLQEAVLPRTLDTVVLLATDQDAKHPQDTVYVAEILRMWLEANGHCVGVGEPNPTRRWIKRVVIETIPSLPHVIESVAYFCRTRFAGWAQESERIVVVHGGGTPAMKMGVLIAACRISDRSIRHIQVPEPHRSGQYQSLIEMDVDDMPEIGAVLRP